MGKSGIKNRDLAIVAIICLLGAYVFGVIPGVPAPDWFNGGDPVIPGQNVDPQDAVSVTKTVTFVGVDELAGGSLDGTTSALVVYDSDGTTLLETLTFSSGKIASSAAYQSGRTLWIKYYYDTTIDSYMWWQFTVPKMGAADAESLSTNTVTLRTREAGAYTDLLTTSSGMTLSDAADVNTTGSTNDTLTMTYSIFTTSDNTGYPQFHDPIYNEDMKIIFWAALSGTGYETINLSGFDGSFAKGTTQYYYKVLTPDQVSKQKVGNEYPIPGSTAITFGVSASGYANTTSSYTTLQCDMVVYSSVDYMETYGSFGPYHFHGCETTVEFMDI